MTEKIRNIKLHTHIVQSELTLEYPHITAYSLSPLTDRIIEIYIMNIDLQSVQRGGDSGNSIFTGAVVGGLLGLGAVAAAPFALAGKCDA